MMGREKNTLKKGIRNVFLIVAAVLVLLGVSSCGNRSTVKKINKTLTIAYRMPVTTDDHPWMMIRGIYAFGQRFVLVDSVTQEKRQAMNHLAGNTMAGLVDVDSEGPFFSEAAGVREGELQRNLFNAAIVQSGVTNETGFLDQFGKFYSIESFVRRGTRILDVGELTASEEVVSGPEGNELGWTLVMLGASSLVTSKWENYRGVMTNTEDILKIALSRPVNWGTDEGFIEQTGIAYVLKAYKLYRLKEEMGLYEAEMKNNGNSEIPAPALDGVLLEGVWEDAQNHVDNVVKILEKNQNSDGSFSSGWHSEKRKPEDAEETVLYTGYALDYLSIVLMDDELDAPWVKKAVSRLCGAVKYNRFQLYERIWTLSQAAHALRNYRDRLNNSGMPFVLEREFESDDLPPEWPADIESRESF